MDEWASFLTKLIDVSPYAALLVVTGIGFFLMYRIGIKAHKELADSAIREYKETSNHAIDCIRIAYQQARGL